MKKYGSVFLVFFLVLSGVLMGCSSKETSGSSSGTVKNGGSAGGGTSDNGTITIKVADYFAKSHPQNVALREKFKPLVEKKSGGKIKVEIYPNSELGAEQEFYDGVRNGTIEMGIPGMIMQNTLPKLGVPEWPFLFKDLKSAHDILNGEIGDHLLANLEKKHGVHPLAWSANGFRMFSSNQPIKSLKDFQGLRLRMPQIDSYIALGKALGANVTPMPISEVFSALQQGVIDGQDNPIATVRASKWYEVQDYELESRHIFSPNLYVINSKFWNNLSEKQQKIIQDAATKSANYEWELLEGSYKKDKAFLQKQGMKFITPSDEFMRNMKEAVDPLYQKYFKKYPWAKDVVEKVRNAQK